MSVASLADPEPVSREPRVDPAGVLAPAIEVDHVDFTYGPALALRDVTLDIPRHEVMAFIGPSGCGKSTLLRCFNRMNDVIDHARVTGGQIRIDGRDINLRTVDAIRLRQQVGMVFQKSNPFPRSIFENVAYGLRIQGMRNKAEIEERVYWSLTVSALWAEVKDRLDTSAFGLSGGQQQRLCIARAIAVKPSIILMDEPCSALDPIATLKIEELITHLKEQFTIVIVTHNMQQATRCSDRTAFFFLGELIEHGLTSDLFSNPKNPRTEEYVSGRFG